MKTVKPTESFTGYVSGNRTEFTAGVSIPVPDDYAEILAAKGLIQKPKALTGTASRMSGPEITNLPTRKASADK